MTRAEAVEKVLRYQVDVGGQWSLSPDRIVDIAVRSGLLVLDRSPRERLCEALRSGVTPYTARHVCETIELLGLELVDKRK